MDGLLQKEFQEKVRGVLKGDVNKGADSTHGLENQVVVESPCNEIGSTSSMVAAKVWED